MMSFAASAVETVDGRWRICTFVSCLGVFFLVFLVRQRQDIPSFTSPWSSAVPTAPAPVYQVTDSSSSIEIINETEEGEGGKCDIYDGKWVYDPESSPLYTGPQCPFLSDQVSCQRNRRPDSCYERWSWEGNQCDIPRFNGTDMLERLRGKRVVIVGDSLNRNQWESLACVLYSSVPSSETHVNARSSTHKIFQAKRYNCSVEFYWSPFLVQLRPSRTNGSRVLRLDRLPPIAKRWRGPGVVIFNTGHWWVHRGEFQAWDLLQYKGELMQDMETEKMFETAMKTWARWVDRKINTNETMVFFRSISPEHKGKLWCHNVTEPTLDGSYDSTFPKSIGDIAERTVRGMRVPVKILNITRLSEHRRDAHPTIYTTKQGKLVTEEQRKKPEIYCDCSHWCVPGVPDTWNRLLYATMVLDRFGEGYSSTACNNKPRTDMIVQNDIDLSRYNY